ncbi:MAG: hypothetical protein AAGA37_22975 [Actinomycetota bacterium]
MTWSRGSWLVAWLGVAAAVGLLLPWARSGDRTRSSIELLSSANALGVIEGWPRVALFVGWFGVVAGAAVGLVFVAWDRPRLGAGATAVVGPALVLALVGLRLTPFGVAWGAWVASGLGVTASIGSGLIHLNGQAMHGKSGDS